MGENDGDNLGIILSVIEGSIDLCTSDCFVSYNIFDSFSRHWF